MAIEVKKREGENVSSVLFRFNKRIKQSGVMKEVKGRRFKKRPANRRVKRLSALYKTAKNAELARQKKLGFS